MKIVEDIGSASRIFYAMAKGSHLLVIREAGDSRRSLILLAAVTSSINIKAMEVDEVMVDITVENEIVILSQLVGEHLLVVDAQASAIGGALRLEVAADHAPMATDATSEQCLVKRRESRI